MTIGTTWMHLMCHMVMKVTHFGRLQLNPTSSSFPSKKNLGYIIIHDCECCDNDRPQINFDPKHDCCICMYIGSKAVINGFRAQIKLRLVNLFVKLWAWTRLLQLDNLLQPNILAQ